VLAVGSAFVFATGNNVVIALPRSVLELVSNTLLKGREKPSRVAGALLVAWGEETSEAAVEAAFNKSDDTGLPAEVTAGVKNEWGRFVDDVVEAAPRKNGPELELDVEAVTGTSEQAFLLVTSSAGTFLA